MARHPLGEVVKFPRKPPRREHPYSAAVLARVRETVERMVADGFSEDEAYEVAVIQLRIMEGSHGGN